MASCFFCGVGGPETAIELQFKTKPTFKMDDIVKITGTLELNRDDIYHFCLSRIIILNIKSSTHDYNKLKLMLSVRFGIRCLSSVVLLVFASLSVRVWWKAAGDLSTRVEIRSRVGYCQ